MKRWIVAAILIGLGAGAAAGAPTGKAIAGKPGPVSVVLKTRDGSSLVGTLSAPRFRLKTKIGKVSIPYMLARRVEWEEKNRAAKVEFANGDRLSGIWLEPALVVDTAFGSQNFDPAFILEMRIHAAVRRDGLLAHYPFDRDQDGMVRDASGNGRDGKFVGAVVAVEGKQGGACRVGRQYGHVQVSPDAAWNFGDQPFSIALWIKLEQMPVGEQMIVGHDEGGGEQNKWAFEFWQGNLCFHVNSPRSESFRIGATPWRGEVGRWHHLAVTRSGSDFRIYVDGVCVSEARHGLAVPEVRAPLTIGQGEGLHVEGPLDEVMIFGRALNLEEIRDLAR